MSSRSSRGSRLWSDHESVIIMLRRSKWYRYALALIGLVAIVWSTRSPLQTPKVPSVETLLPELARKATLHQRKPNESKGDLFWAYVDPTTASHSQCRQWRKTIDTNSLITTTTPPRRHPRPVLGIEDLYKADGCYTYKDRFSRYSDEGLGFTYRDQKDLSLIAKVLVDPIKGPIRPETFEVKEWVSYLKKRNIYINRNATRDDAPDIPSWRALSDGCGSSVRGASVRTAVVLRFYEGYVLTEDEVLNTRALVVEMVLSRPQKGWDVRILVETKQTSHAFASHEAKEKILTPMLPREFWGLVEFWSESFIELMLPGLATGPSNAWRGPYNQDRGCIIATQVFSLLHPEYDFVYNWEGDIRFLGDFRIFFDAIENWSKQEPFSNALAKYDTWLIRNSKGSEKHWFIDDKSVEYGRGKEADLIVFNPMFEVSNSGWWYQDDFQNIDLSTPRRASIVSSLRMSRDLIKGMNLAAAETKKSMSCEAWPVTAVLHSHFSPSDSLMYQPNATFLDKLPFPFKGVFVPHPVYFDEIYTPKDMEDRLWVPEFMAFEHEDFMQGSSYYYTTHYSWKIYSDWKEGFGHGRCRKAALLHPIKTSALLGEV